jgi:hypothetical protein
MKRVGGILLVAVALAGLWLAGCVKNDPLAPSTSSTTAYNGVAEPITSDVLFCATSASTTTSLATFNPVCASHPASTGGVIQYSWGGTSYVIDSTHPGGTAPGGGAGLQSVNLLLLTPGIGGPLGNFQNSYYLSFQGYKGPNASTDYNSLIVNFLQGVSTPLDLTCYHGFMFYARGNGKFGVQLAATGVKTGQAGPYTDYNYYEYVFGDQMSTTTWKQFVVNFTDPLFIQQYGTVVNLHAVIQNATGLQFIQETPYTPYFQLDLDYIRFF